MTILRQTIVGVLATIVVIISGCSGGATTTKQAPMSGNDPNYPHAGVFSGEDGRGLIYSSDWKRAKDVEQAPSTAAAAATAAETEAMSAEERADYEAWKAERESQREQEEFEAWKKARDEAAAAQ